MSKTLQVVEPFFNLYTGDILELSEDGKNYVIECNEEHSEVNANGGDMSTSFSSRFTISVDYARQLVEDEVLSEVIKQDNTFVNVFTEIDNLLFKYTRELDNLEKEMASSPACLRIEKATVLENMIKLLGHLKSLKK